MEVFENKLIRGIHVSQYVMSWYMAGGKTRGYKAEFDPVTKRRAVHMKDWLRTLVIDGEHLTTDEVCYIYNFARTGKSELRGSAMDFLKNL